MQIEEFFEYLLQNKGSDLHLKVGVYPSIRVKGELVRTDFPHLTEEDMNSMVKSLLTPEQHHQVRMNLANTLHAVVSQRLVKRADGSGRVAVMEIMINSPRIKKLIEENRITMIPKAIEESKSFYHMQSFNQSFFDLVRANVITQDEALSNSLNPSDLKLKMRTSGYVSQRGSKVEDNEEPSSVSQGKQPSPF